MYDSEKFELILVPSPNDASLFSDEYQRELRLFSRSAKASSQRAFAMDSVVGGGGPLGEFIFNHSEALITALTTLCSIWLNGRFGRKLKLKVGEIEIEASTTEEIEAMVKQVQSLQKRNRK